ncbi:hypothetical protein INT45_009794 [Circinella minor]|uniref:Uncharacterized protein n=1 Tax=Circinella minor TaxID=1195481 RepID=A0A8H7VCJ1_9FUNG|nr:hypothetical protein INT45_009794 [Circinella minor]
MATVVRRRLQHKDFFDDEYRTFEASLVHACQTTPSPAELQLQSAIPDVSRRLDVIDIKLEMHQHMQMEAYHRENVQLREKMNMMCSQLDRFMSASSTNLTSERPVYHLNQSIKTVAERQEQAERQAFSRRLNIIKAVNDIAEQKGIPADERFRAAEMLDEVMNRRGWKLLNALINDLKGNANVLNDLSVRKTF